MHFPKDLISYVSLTLPQILSIEPIIQRLMAQLEGRAMRVSSLSFHSFCSDPRLPATGFALTTAHSTSRSAAFHATHATA